MRSIHTCVSSLLLLGLVIGAAAPARAQALFDAPWIGYNAGDFTTGRSPVALLTEDFTGDGRPDAILARGNWNSGFAFLRNTGDGTFLPPVHHASAGPETWGVAAGDFDEDGDRDVVTSNANAYYLNASTISLFRNDGSGDVRDAQHFAAGQGVVDVTAADFNGDAHLDLAVANYRYLGSGTTVSVLHGDGTGAFAAPVAVTTAAGPYALDAGDMDGDGDVDLVVGHEEYRVTVLRNDGAGTFVAVPYPLSYNGASPFYPAVEVADVDNDSDLDVLYANTRTWDGDVGHVALLRNNGAGTLAAQQNVPMIPYSAGPVNLETADLNGDGWLDLLAAHNNGRVNDGVMVAMSNGSGGYLPTTAYWGGQATHDVAAADVDGDGDVDLLSSDWDSMELTVHENPGDGQFGQPRYSEAAPASLYVDFGDVDHDGDLDAFTSGGGAGGSNPALQRNDGTGTFSAPTTYGAGSFGKLRDLNGDGHLDLLYASNPTASAYDFFVAFGTGTGAFGAVTRWVLNACGSGHVDAFDLDNDADLDVVMTEYGGCPGVPNSYRRVFVRLNLGDGTFEAPYTLVTDQYGPFPIAGADLDRDGNVDLAVGHKGAYGASNTVVVLYGDGNGQVRERQTYTVGFGPHDLVAADLNGDGWLDLATGNTGADGPGQETISVLLNTGGVGFGTAATQYAPYSSDLLGVTGIASGDADADGDLDLMVSNYASKDVAFYENDGTGAFDFHTRYGVGGNLFDAHYADVTGDGAADLAGLIGLRPGGGISALAVVPGLFSTPTADEPPTPGAPAAGLALSAPTPNPTRGTARLTLTLAVAQAVRVEAFDALGRRVALLHDGALAAGAHAVPFSAAGLPAGLYLVRATGAGGARATRRLIVAQ